MFRSADSQHWPEICLNTNSVQLGRPSGRSKPLHRRRAGDSRHGQVILSRAHATASAWSVSRIVKLSLSTLIQERQRCLPKRGLRQEDPRRNGRARPPRSDDPRLPLRGRQQRRLRPHHPRSRARRLRLPIRNVRAKLPGHGRNRRVRHPRTEGEIPTGSRERQTPGLLRPDGTEPRLGSRIDGDDGKTASV